MKNLILFPFRLIVYLFKKLIPEPAYEPVLFDKVVITKGFYKGYTGQVVAKSRYEEIGYSVKFDSLTNNGHAHSEDFKASHMAPIPTIRDVN